MDVIVNKDLTKKVLAALNPNKIFDEDQLEKQLAVVRSQRPFGESEEEKASQVIEESKKGVDSSIAKKLRRTPRASRNLFKPPESNLQGRPTLKSQKDTRKLNIRSGINQKHFNRWKKGKITTASPASAPITAEPTRKPKKPFLASLFPTRKPKKNQPRTPNVI